MTAQQAAARQEEEEAVALPLPETGPTRAGTRGRASSVPAEPPTAQPEVTERDGAAWPELVRAWLLMRVSAAKDRPLDLIHGPPATIGAMHARHQQAAAHWNAPVVRKLRLAWGLLHTGATAAVYAVLDAVFSPAGFVLTVLSVIGLIYWL